MAFSERQMEKLNRLALAIEFRQWLQNYAESKGEHKDNVTDRDTETLVDFYHYIQNQRSEC